jgi:predicted  nucleic acid-binding Zn-ribbon protein
MNRTSRADEKRVMELHFKAVSRDSIASQLGIPPATVSDILSVLPQNLGPLRALSIELRKKGMSVADALVGVGIRNDLEALGITPDQFSFALEAVMKMAAGAGYTPEVVVQAAGRVLAFEKEVGKGYSEALEQSKLLNKKIGRDARCCEKLKKRKLQLKSQIGDGEQRLARVFEEADEAPKAIEEFKDYKKKLWKYRLTLKEVGIVAMLLDDVEEVGGNPKEMVSLVKEVGSLSREKVNLGNSVKELRKEKGDMMAQVAAVSAELKRDNNLLGELEEKIQSNWSILASQDYQIRRNYAQLCSIWSDYQRIDGLRREAISQFGRMAGLSGDQIQQIQLESDFDVACRSLQKEFDAFLKQFLKGFS